MKIHSNWYSLANVLHFYWKRCKVWSVIGSKTSTWSKCCLHKRLKQLNLLWTYLKIYLTEPMKLSYLRLTCYLHTSVTDLGYRNHITFVKMSIKLIQFWSQFGIYADSEGNFSYQWQNHCRKLLESPWNIILFPKMVNVDCHNCKDSPSLIWWKFQKAIRTALDLKCLWKW